MGLLLDMEALVKRELAEEIEGLGETSLPDMPSNPSRRTESGLLQLRVTMSINKRAIC
jgi:hypothetical protein